MTSLNNFFGKPTTITGVGEIYPITMRDYDEFMDIVNIIMLKKSQFPFNEDDLSRFFENPSQLRILDYIAINSALEQSDELLEGLKRIFELTTKESVKYLKSEDSVAFFIGNVDESPGHKKVIHSKNFDQVRECIMTQNLIVEPKEYANPLVAKWAAKAAEAKAKSSAKTEIDMESILSSLQMSMGQKASFFEDFTIYQIYSAFSRLGKFNEFETDLALIGHSDQVGNVHFAEVIDLTKNPEDGAFKESSSLEGITKHL
ncbi:hypothetical protein [Bacillus sp. Marseille-P3800]|uniref:hypothetical protein n=1 Tax=Bacillus sp. Marseille-P3800 TaxID=2014782 RepID=UPI000C07CBE6|nr:hypothetical protein [Bacillus sp. Marseille-P3800]